MNIYQKKKMKEYKKVPYDLELGKKILKCEVDGHVGVRIEKDEDGHEHIVDYMEVAVDQ